ncbi:DUF397 domain-containing protein [Streptomyces mutabilis]|jgi:hypothetical protein|uniref:DUF397 domain-containing protein n=1 Tax=Streptomyces mutabilis TaxID=67332 RepID=UPI00342CCE15
MRSIPEHHLDWYKSSYSGGSGGNCLEVARWRKSSHSAGDGGDCLEVAADTTDVVPIRDSKDPHGARLRFQAEAWSAFVGAIKAAPAPK